jgi:5'(3')-deoxyribonucleotidase
MNQRTIAVDLDGVLYDALKRMIDYVRYVHNKIIDPSRIKVYNPACLTGIREIDLELVKQVQNPEFFLEMKPFSDTYKSLYRLRKHSRLIVVSNRAAHLRQVSYMTVERDFPSEDFPDDEVFMELHLQKSTPKHRIAKARGATWAIDDNPNVAEEYAKHKIVCFLLGARRSFRPHTYIKPVNSLSEVADFFDNIQKGY